MEFMAEESTLPIRDHFHVPGILFGLSSGSSGLLSGAVAGTVDAGAVGSAETASSA